MVSETTQWSPASQICMTAALMAARPEAQAYPAAVFSIAARDRPRAKTVGLKCRP